MDIKTLRGMAESGVGVTGFDFKFKIDKVMKFIKGEGEYGPWTLQNVVLVDSTGKIQAVIKNHPEIQQSAVGKFLQVRCKESKGELKGTKVEKETYEDDNNETKETIKISVTKIADLQIVSEDGGLPSGSAQNTPKKVSNEEFEAYFVRATEFLTSERMSAMAKAVQGAGWTSEDLRAFAITLYLGNR